VLAALVATVACWCSLGGAQTMWPIALLLPCWLAVRRRPLVTWAATALPLAVAVAVGDALPYVADKTAVFTATGAAIALAALGAREFALRVRIRLVLSDSIPPGPRAAGPAPVD
jgi:hypothetical protein